MPGDSFDQTNSIEHLPTVIASIRRQGKQKIVICIDQFEQWLFSHSTDIEHASLTKAIRQCDGLNVQCLLMVRDDFWMGITRFMQAIDQSISENNNATSVDLFDLKHAEKVLTMFGIAFGKLPSDPTQISGKQSKFIQSAVRSLAIDDRVICVQVALLAEMIRNRDWNQVEVLLDGSGDGIGLQFLEQTFDSENASRRVKQHADGAQRVLRSLLPEGGGKIKGAVRSEQFLFEACNYRDQSSFRELLAILDAELHLITPTDGSQNGSFSNDSIASVDSETGYQLTHDFLINPVRKWSEIRNLSTRQGQAQARLEEFTELYRMKPIVNSLPSLLQFASIASLIPRSDWSEQQSRMMRAAARNHFRRVSTFLGLLTIVLLMGGLTWNAINRAYQIQIGKVEIARLLDAGMNESITQAKKLQSDRGELFRELTEIAHSNVPEEKRVKAALVTYEKDEASRSLIVQYYLNASPVDVLALSARPDWLDDSTLNEFTQRWIEQTGSGDQLLRIACLLAQNGSTHQTVLKLDRSLVQLLLQQNPTTILEWAEGFYHLRKSLLPLLIDEFKVLSKDDNSLTLNAANLIAFFAADQPEVLARHVAIATERSFQIFVNALKPNALAKKLIEETILATDVPQTIDERWKNEATSDWWMAPDISIEHVTKQLNDSSILRNVLDSAAVVYDTRHFLAHSLTKQEIAPVDEELSKVGFRIAFIVCSERRGSNEQSRDWMVLWKRDGRAAKYVISVSAEQLRVIHQQNFESGLFAEHASSYSPDEYRSYLFNCVWTTSPPLPFVAESDMYIDVPEKDHMEHGWGRYNDRGFTPRMGIARPHVDERGALTSIRWRMREGIRYSDMWDGSLQRFETYEKWNQNLVLVQATRANGNPQDHQGMVGIWWTGLPIDSKFVKPQEKELHIRACQKMIEDGYRIQDIYATNFELDGPLLFNSVWWRPQVDISKQTVTESQIAKLILALFEIGAVDQLKTAILDKDRPGLRGYLVHGFSRYQLELDWLVDRAIDPSNQLLQLASLQALMLYRGDNVSDRVKERLTAGLQKCLDTTISAGMRSAIEHLSETWQIQFEHLFIARSEREYTSSSGQRMIILTPPKTIWLGSQENEPGRDFSKEPRMQVAIGRTFSVASKETTVEQYLKYKPEHEYIKHYSPTSDSPMNSVSWLDAAKYCRWLSEQESIPENEMCYPAIEEIKPGMVLPEGFLNRTGYRLPTEAEWEFCCRAGYDTARHFGYAPELLNYHGWTAQNSNFRFHPVGSLVPNDFGFYDMLGNAMELCMDMREPYPWPSTEIRKDLAANFRTVNFDDRRACRGGCVLYQPLDARAAQRNDHEAGGGRIYLSFRIARTIKADSPE